MKSRGYWKNWENFEAELREVIKEKGGEFPADRELRKMGKSSLSKAFNYHGGINAVRKRMGYESEIKPRGYWQIWKNFESELRMDIKQNNGRFPVIPQLEENGRKGILNSLKYYGGIDAVRKRMGFESEKKAQ